jgi:hypothetical protein
MTALTEEEVRAFVERHAWSSGIKADKWALRYDDPEANALYLKFPETPLQAPYFSRVVSMLGAEDESMFYGALLWITLSDIGSPQIEKTGWAMVEMMRRSFGENRPLEVAPGHWFRNGAVVELAAFILPCFVFGWDAYIIPDRGDLFIHISHDEYWAVITKNVATYETTLTALNSIELEQGNQHLLRRFCPSSRHLQST